MSTGSKSELRSLNKLKNRIAKKHAVYNKIMDDKIILTAKQERGC